MSFWTGSDAKYDQKSLLQPNQQRIQQQQANAAQGRGAGGAFGDSADYYRDLLSNNSQDFQNFAAPEMRRFNEQIIPDLGEQFAGMGSGGMSSSGFRNAAVSAGTDLSERLASIRSGLRSSAADRLSSMGQAALNQYSENVYTPRSPGFLETAANAAGQVAGAYAGGGVNAGVKGLSNWLNPSNSQISTS